MYVHIHVPGSIQINVPNESLITTYIMYIHVHVKLHVYKNNISTTCVRTLAGATIACWNHATRVIGVVCPKVYYMPPKIAVREK